eukprot:COSAG01_NODE_24138_length_789_cov_0.823188_2_plen_27_part_01
MAFPQNGVPTPRKASKPKYPDQIAPRA